mgnify:CR=1 FL=1
MNEELMIQENEMATGDLVTTEVQVVNGTGKGILLGAALTLAGIGVVKLFKKVRNKVKEKRKNAYVETEIKDTNESENNEE